MKITKRPCALVKALFTAMVLVYLSGAMAPAVAETPDINPDYEWVVVTVTIDGKADGPRFIFLGERRFRVSPSAKIFDQSGREIPLRYVRVPCKAEITYCLFSDHRDPLVEKIRLKY